MTQTQDALDTALPPQGRPRLSGARKAIIVLGALALACGIAAAIAVPLVASSASSRVISHQDARPVTCRDQVPTTVPADDADSLEPDQEYYQAIALSEELDCQLRFFVTNNSDIPVEITGASLSMAGPWSSMGILATSIDGEPIDLSSHEVDASLHFSEPYPLASGETIFYTAQLEFNEAESCMQFDALSFAAIVEAPAIYVNALGIESTQEGLPGGYGLTATEDSDSGCE